MRDVQPESKSSSLSIAKTLATSLIIGGIIAFAAMFFALYQNRESMTDPLSYYLPWCLSYGIPAILFAGYGVFALTELRDIFVLRKITSIIAFILAASMFGGAFPIWLALHSGDFCISLIVIALCIGVMGYLNLSQLNKEFPKK